MSAQNLEEEEEREEEEEEDEEEGPIYHTDAINQMCTFKLRPELPQTGILTCADMNISPLCAALRLFAPLSRCVYMFLPLARLFTPVSEPGWHVLTRRFIIPTAIGAIHP